MHPVLVILFFAIAAFVLSHQTAVGDDTTSGRPLLTKPLLRGALWWPGVKWTREQLRDAIVAQHDVGFDILWVCGSGGMVSHAEKADAQGEPDDILEMIYSLADEYEMKVIIDFPQGGWHGRADADAVIETVTAFLPRLHQRYGEHESFYGWYLNYEINPIWPNETKITAYWHKVWKAIVDECHRLAPDAVVTISPFFLLDVEGHRGFKYMEPALYEQWWTKTLAVTGIDILMLQDSGAAHTAFFTLAEREPFLAAHANACRKTGTEFWVNVETGQFDVADWKDFMSYDNKSRPMRFTPVDWLEQKLQLAAKYGTGIINWGYFPFMKPDGDDAAVAAYEAYKAYYERVR